MRSLTDPEYDSLSYSYNMAKLAKIFAKVFGMEIKFYDNCADFELNGVVQYSLSYLPSVEPRRNLDAAFNHFLMNSPNIVDYIRDLQSGESNQQRLDIARLKLGIAHQIIEWSVFQWHISGNQDTRFLPFQPHIYQDPSWCQAVHDFHRISCTIEQYSFPYKENLPISGPQNLQQFFEGVRALDRSLSETIKTAAKLASDAIGEFRNQQLSINPSEAQMIQCVKGLTSSSVQLP